MTKPLSYACGPGSDPLAFETIGDLLSRAAAESGDRDAVVMCHQSIRWNYAKLNEVADQYAAGLIALGFEKGDRLGVWAPNCIEWVVMQFATAKAGIIQVNINPAFRASELEFVLNKTGCRGIVLAETFKTSNYVEMIQKLAPEISKCAPNQLSAPGIPNLKLASVISDAPPPGFLPFKSIADLGKDVGTEPLEARARELSPDDPINIQFTSGTTGLPKGATLTHHGILNNAHAVGERQNFSPDDRLCIPVPLYHVFGMVMGVLACLTHRACMVFPGESFDPLETLTAVASEKCTSLYGVPTMFIAQLAHEQFDSFDLSSLRTGCMAGAPCPTEIMNKVIESMNMREVTIAYGMTETSVSFQTEATAPIDKRVETVGTALPYLECKIVDEDNICVPLGVQGELLARGYSVMLGYWADDDKTLGAIDAASWMHTGDLATMDEDGFVRITGRSKDMIIRGGENVYPREIEDYLLRHPEIQDAQVFGLPDDKYGEVVAVWIQSVESSSLDADGVRDFCKGQIAHYKIPHHIQFVSEFPMTVTGKIQKFKMRDTTLAQLNA